MDKRLQAYFDRIQQRNRQDKDKVLISQGLYEETEIPVEEYVNDIYHNFEQDNDTIKYYKRTPIEVNDEEYEIIVENLAHNIELEKETRLIKPSLEQKTTFIGNALYFIATLVYIISFIGGIIIMDDIGGIGFGVMVSGFIFGTVLLGFAKVINLLHSINEKL